MRFFVNVSPAFYKTLLFNAINKIEAVKVAYQDSPNRPYRTSDFFDGEKEFHYVYMTGKRISICRQLASLIKTTHYDEIIVGGYDCIYPWLTVFLSPRRKNSVIVESTLRGTGRSLLRVLLKRIFFMRVCKAYVCGKSHADLVRYFGFKGEIVDIGSVGFIHRVPQPPYQARRKVENFVYVGRLVEVKNLEWTIKRFTAHPELKLTIIGTGVLEEKLKSMAPDNVQFAGVVPNAELPKYYQNADVFILPSNYETYGLVVEEALNNGTPVLVSHMVGCQDNLVAANKVGLVFQLNDIDDFEDKLSQIRNIKTYNQLRKNVSKLDFKKFEKNMVNSFVG